MSRVSLADTPLVGRGAHTVLKETVMKKIAVILGGALIAGATLIGPAAGSGAFRFYM